MALAHAQLSNDNTSETSRTFISFLKIYQAITKSQHWTLGRKMMAWSKIYCAPHLAMIKKTLKYRAITKPKEIGRSFAHYWEKSVRQDFCY